MGAHIDRSSSSKVTIRRAATGTARITIGTSPGPPGPPGGSDEATAEWVESGPLTKAALSATYARKRAVQRLRTIPRPTLANPVMATPPTIGALATATAIASGRLIPAGPVIAVNNATPNRSVFTFYAEKVEQLGIVNPDYNYMKARYLTDPFTSPGGGGAVEFLFDGTTLEVLFKGITNTVWVAVDDEYVASTAIIVANSGAQYYLPITFATRATRRIRVEFNQTFIFGGVQIGANDSVNPVPPIGPKVMVHGDSFSEGRGGGYSDRPWWRTMGNALGWRNVVSTSLGGTGWLATGPGSRPKFRDRLATDVYPYAPEILFLAGGINDTSFTQSQIEAEATTALADITANLPNTLVVVIGPFGKDDVAASGPYWPIRDALRSAAATAGALFVDLLEQTPAGAMPATTLASGSAASATTLSTVGPIPRGSTIKVDAERRVVTSCTGAGPYTVTVANALSSAHSSGAAVEVVGGSLWTTANKSLLVGADGTHPTQAGSDAIGHAVAAQVARLLAL